MNHVVDNIEESSKNVGQPADDDHHVESHWSNFMLFADVINDEYGRVLFLDQKNGPNSQTDVKGGEDHTVKTLANE